MTKEIQISALWWLWIPIIFIIFQIGLEISLPREVRSVLHSENGPHETLQFLIMVGAFFVALRGLAVSIQKSKSWLVAWFGLAVLSCLYVAGEEVSWGQHIFDWATPEFWNDYNDQQETNLHNTSSWLDQKPRLILEIGIIAGGLLFPAIEKIKQGSLPQKFRMIYPSPTLWVVALLVIAPKLMQSLGETFDVYFFARVSEVQELYMFYFVILYLIMLVVKTRES